MRINFFKLLKVTQKSYTLLFNFRCCPFCFFLFHFINTKIILVKFINELAPFRNSNFFLKISEYFQHRTVRKISYFDISPFHIFVVQRKIVPEKEFFWFFYIGCQQDYFVVSGNREDSLPIPDADGCLTTWAAFLQLCRPVLIYQIQLISHVVTSISVGICAFISTE